jgi:hypothetical protein
VKFLRFFFLSSLLLSVNLKAIELSEKLLLDIARTNSYIIGQTYALDTIKKKYPNLSNQVFIAKSEFDLSFSKSIKNIDTTMSKYDGWESIKKNMAEDVVKKLDYSNLTHNESVAFIETIKQRARGKIETPILETLLMFHPNYEKNPEKEFYDGFKKKYISDDLKKSKGVEFALHVPMSWISKEANRPNIVRKFISQNGHSTEMAMILVLDFPEGDDLTANYIKSFINQEYMQKNLPPDAILKDYGFFTLETLPGYWQRYTLTVERMKFKLTSETLSYTLFYKDKMIQIQFQVGDFDDKDLEQKFKKFEPLFDSIVNSFVLTDLYTSKR